TISIYAIKRKYFKLIDLLIEKIVLIRRLIQKYYSLKFALYYNELLINGYDSTDIIVMLYEQIDDSDIKMIIYEIYRQVLEGEALEDIINDFEYFEPLFIAYFKLLIHDNQKDKSLDNYLRVSIDTLHMQVTRLIKLFVPIIYCFVAGFVILVYVAIVIPMMNVVSNL
ncbi:type II secretion system F family protein, partial [Thomasclavelia ramosa]